MSMGVMCTEAATERKIALMTYLVRWYRPGIKPDSRYGIAINVVANICNTPWDLTRATAASLGIRGVSEHWRRHVINA